VTSEDAGAHGAHPQLARTELVWSTGWEPRPSNPIAIVGAIILVTVSAATVGALLASRRPRHPVGWLLLGVGLGLVVTLLLQS
jgi:hypothetical protein